MQDMNQDELEKYKHSIDLQRWTLEGDQLREHCLLDVGRHTLQPCHNLGKLDVLPPELLTTMLIQLDVQSLTNFRRVNQRAMRFVDSIPQYRVVVEHAPNALRGMLSVRCATFSTIEDLYHKLCTATCENCSDFGGYLYLITCKRMCCICLMYEESFSLLHTADVVRKYGLKPGHMASIPNMRSHPGLYSSGALICRQSCALYDQESARSIALSIHGTVEKMEKYVDDAVAQRLDKFKQRLSRYESGGKTGKKPRRPRQVYEAMNGRHRFMAIIPLPYFNAQTKLAEQGFNCVGCSDEDGDDDGDGPALHWEREFNTETFIDHMRQWGDIQKGYHVRSKNWSARAWPTKTPVNGRS